MNVPNVRGVDGSWFHFIGNLLSRSSVSCDWQNPFPADAKNIAQSIYMFIGESFIAQWLQLINDEKGVSKVGGSKL